MSFVVVDSSAVREVVVGNPEAERLIAGVEAGLRVLLSIRLVRARAHLGLMRCLPLQLDREDQ